MTKVSAEQYVKNSLYLNTEIQTDDLPVYEEIKHLLPRPIWNGHDDAVNCYYKAWELAFGNIKKAAPFLRSDFSGKNYLSSRKYARPRLAGGRLLFFLRKMIMIRTATVAR